MRAIIGALRGTTKRFVYTSGCLIYGSTGDTSATEDSRHSSFRQGRAIPTRAVYGTGRAAPFCGRLQHLVHSGETDRPGRRVSSRGAHQA